MKQQLSMKTISILLSHFIIFFIHVQSQNTTSQNVEVLSNPQDSFTNFQPSLAVVIGMLSIVFSLTFVLLLYAKFCHRQSSGSATAEQTRDWLIPSRPHAASGIHKTVIESLPSFRFSLLKGSREGLECSVCLSKFDDFEILRLLPKCKHAFHIDCIDHWLEKHSSCPLCRQKVGINDLSQMAYSNSFRFLWNQTELREESNLEIYVQREDDHFGSSIEEIVDAGDQDKKTTLHRFKHKIVVSDAGFVIKNRWSNVSPSDIMSLKSEMINDVTSSRFSCLNSENDIRVITDIHTTSDSSKVVLNTDNKRSMSEITVHSRFMEFKNVGDHSSNVEEERKRMLWLPIARKTVNWLANRETKNIEKLSLNQLV